MFFLRVVQHFLSRRDRDTGEVFMYVWTLSKPRIRNRFLKARTSVSVTLGGMIIVCPALPHRTREPPVKRG